MTDETTRSETTPERETRTHRPGDTPAIEDEVLDTELAAERGKNERLMKLEELKRLRQDNERLEHGLAGSPASSTGSESKPRTSEPQPDKLPEYYGKSIREHTE
jgi:hypothetical protein